MKKHNLLQLKFLVLANRKAEINLTFHYGKYSINKND